MARPIVMPSFGMYTIEGTLAAWLRPGGAQVAEGEPVAEIETDKAVYQIEAPAAGILHVVLDRGASLAVETLMGWILAEGEALPAGAAAQSPPLMAPAPVLPEPRPETPVPARASPAARRLAAERGVDLETIAGSGPGGRIVEADVEAAARRAGR